MAILKSWRPGPGAALISALSGLALAAAFPPLDLWPLCLVALVPMMLLCRRLSPRRAMVCGAIFGLALFLGLMYWLMVVFVTYGGLHWGLGLLALLLFTWYMSWYPTAWCWLLARWRGSAFALLLVAPLAWVGLEWLRGHIFTGVPWLPLGMGLYGATPLLQSAEFWGTGGLCLMVVLVNALLALAVAHLMERRGTRAAPLACLAGVAIILAGGWFWGQARVSQVRAQEAKAPSIVVSVVQANQDLNEMWRPGNRRQVVKDHVGLTQMAAAHVERRPWLVIWPESAAPFYFLRDARPSQPALELMKGAGMHLMLGSLGAVGQGKELKVSNRVWLLEPGGGVQYYDKVHLVPFGEYVPLKQILFFVRGVAQIGDDFAVGQEGKTLKVAETRTGPLICYESIFPELARQQRLAGARLLVNQTNDAWFGRTSAPYQHMAHLALRAIENRLGAARAANTGVSGFILPDGHVEQTTGLFDKAVRTREMPLMDSETFFTRNGDLLGPAALCLTVLLAAWAMLRGRGKTED